MANGDYCTPALGQVGRRRSLSAAALAATLQRVLRRPRCSAQLGATVHAPLGQAQLSCIAGGGRGGCRVWSPASHSAETQPCQRLRQDRPLRRQICGRARSRPGGAPSMWWVAAPALFRRQFFRGRRVARQLGLEPVAALDQLSTMRELVTDAKKFGHAGDAARFG